MKLVEGAFDFGDAKEVRVDGVSGVYQISHNTLCIEFYANKIVDGKVAKVIVLRNIWDRSCWLAAEEIMSKLCARIIDLPGAGSSDDEVRVHCAQKKAPGSTRGGFLPRSGSILDAFDLGCH
jgi:hypothetical protein